MEYRLSENGPGRIVISPIPRINVANASVTPLDAATITNLLIIVELAEILSL
jgi:hypothetical protein